MKRNVYLILITVITILCIIAGTGYHLVRFGLSVAEGLPSFSEFIEAISDWDDDGDDSDDSDDNDDSDNGISTRNNKKMSERTSLICGEVLLGKKDM